MKQNDDARFVELDDALHKLLFELAGLSRTWEVMNFAKAELDRVRFIKRKFGLRQPQLVIDEHSAFVDAIIKRDPDAAERAMRDNVGAVDDEMVSISKNLRLLRTIEDLNQLVALDRRSRGGKEKNQGVAMDLNLAVVVIYFGFLIAIGWAFRNLTANTSDYFRGGGNVLWWMVGASAFMTQFSSWTFTGAAGKAYTDGLAVAFLFVGNALGFFF